MKIDEYGRTVEQIPSLDTLNPEKDPTVLEKHMHHEACFMESIEGMLTKEFKRTGLKKGSFYHLISAYNSMAAGDVRVWKIG